MPNGYFALVLHAHLPFVRHPEDPTVMEEQWLYEAITGTYLPLLQTFEGLIADHVPYRCTVSLSAPLITMLTDDLLKVRYAAHLDKLIELAEKEIDRTRPERHYQRLALYVRRPLPLAAPHLALPRRRSGAARSATSQEAGRVEVITSTATHAFFPAMDRNWANIRAQVHVAADLYEKHFGHRPRGMWLGECGYVPGVDELLREAAIRYFFVDTHGILFADRRPQYGVYAPIYCPSGVAAFGRDMESSEQVWSAQEGYPGDKHYRDFYRDIGFDLPLDYIKPYIHPEGHRDVHGHQVPRHHPQPAARQVGLRPGHRARQGGPARLALPRQPREAGEAPGGHMNRPPIVVSPYDAELYGHWWYEGPMFLGDVFRQMHFDQNDVETITPGDYLDRHDTNQVATPCASSWGAKGYNDYWINETNSWTYRHLHVAGERMIELARRHPNADPLTDARAQSGGARADAGAVLATGRSSCGRGRRSRTPPSGSTSTSCSSTSSTTICASAKVSEHWLADVEARNNIFPQIDYHIYAS